MSIVMEKFEQDDYSKVNEEIAKALFDSREKNIKNILNELAKIIEELHKNHKTLSEVSWKTYEEKAHELYTELLKGDPNLNNLGEIKICLDRYLIDTIPSEKEQKSSDEKQQTENKKQTPIEVKRPTDSEVARINSQLDEEISQIKSDGYDNIENSISELTEIKSKIDKEISKLKELQANIDPVRVTKEQESLRSEKKWDAPNDEDWINMTEGGYMAGRNRF